MIYYFKQQHFSIFLDNFCIIVLIIIQTHGSSIDLFKKSIFDENVYICICILLSPVHVIQTDFFKCNEIKVEDSVIMEA